MKNALVEELAPAYGMNGRPECESPAGALGAARRGDQVEAMAWNGEDRPGGRGAAQTAFFSLPIRRVERLCAGAAAVAGPEVPASCGECGAAMSPGYRPEASADSRRGGGLG